jgi:hypothetical protein
MQFDRNAALEAALKELDEIVRERFRARRPTVAATLKAELQRRFNGRFDERAIGFAGFRDFLKEAEARHVVTLRRAAGGDVEAVPYAVADAAAEPGDAGAPPAAFMRPDLWRTFVDWKPNWTRLYDVAKDRAVMFPTAATPFDAPEWSELRKSVAENPENYLAIEPINAEAQLTWLREFVAQLQDVPTRGVLQSAIGSDRPFGTFARLIETMPDVKARWHRFRLERVLALARDWMDRSGIRITLTEERKELPAERGRASGGEVNEQAVRARLHAAIDRMPVAELLRIELPIGYVLD